MALGPKPRPQLESVWGDAELIRVSSRTDTPIGAPYRAGKQPHLTPIVTIFGAGIAGLSAAHELIERGFCVQVVEPSSSPDEENAAEVGGLARNQVGRVPERPEVLHEDARYGDDPRTAAKFRARVEAVLGGRPEGMKAVQPRIPTPSRILFERSAGGPSAFDPELVDEWGVSNGTKLRALWHNITVAHATYGERTTPTLPAALFDEDAAADWNARERLYVEIRGHTDGDRPEADNRNDSKRWAGEIKDQLKALNREHAELGDDVQFERHFRTIGVGSAEPLGDQRFPEWRRRSNRVEFRIVEQLIPGEHGYRFFPAFYRHLFDLMRRTPILDKEGHATGQTAFDLLVPTAHLGIAVGDNRPVEPIETRRVRSLEELRVLSELFLKRLSVTERDIIRFQTRLVKYLTSSPERRKREYESQSWWDFIGGDDERGYSPQMRTYLMETSQALVAMNAEETDARSQGNIVSQLQLHYLKDHCDYTLNGPTSDVWLRPWKTYLKSQGVRFFVGTLSGLEWQERNGAAGELVPVTSQSSAWLAAMPKRREPRLGAVVEPQGTSRAVLVPRRHQRRIDIDVSGNDPGDYTIVVSGKMHCFSATTETASGIASALADAVAVDDKLDVQGNAARIVIRPRLNERLRLATAPYTFDRSPDSGPVDLVELAVDRFRQPAAVPPDLLEVWPAAPGAVPAVPNPFDDVPPLAVDESVWIAAGLKRAVDPEFDRTLSTLERERRREFVPRFTYDDRTGTLDVEPPAWVLEAIRQGRDVVSDERLELLCPYFFRVGTRGPAAEGPEEPPIAPGAQQAAPPKAPQWAEKTIWVQVRNASGNLHIITDPIPEDPYDEYLSHLDSSAASRPDFYLLALPFTEASTLLWRAEKAKPGRLHGSLAEILDFDRRTSRRTATGDIIPPTRDVDGRPPHHYPLRDFAGIQYYFQNQVRIGAGHIYYPRAEWGLSSISQLAYWRERRSPASAFIGQLSVDIGDFYRRAPVRGGSRAMRSAWNSSSAEIAAEVWFQVRQGLDRERAGLLMAPSYYHLDQGLAFDHALGSTFRDKVTLDVRTPPAPSPFTMWINGQRFSCASAADSTAIAECLVTAVNEHPLRAVDAVAEPLPVNPPGAAAVTRIHLSSAIPDGAALLYIADEKPGYYAVSLGTSHELRTYSHVQRAQVAGSETVRDGLFNRLVRDRALPAVAVLHGVNGILLLPKGGADLPNIALRSEGQALRVVYGGRLEVRLEQCHDCLTFSIGATATIGHNLTPFLINVPGQWQHRPGLLKPYDLTFDQNVLRPRDDERIRYRISNRRWVAVGTYMATTTQLTTMESASESARHAVNAILRCLAFRPGTEYNAQGRVFADLVEVWDPEKHELDDLASLRRLDAKLAEEGLPHVMDILKIIEAVDAIPMHGKPSHDPFANILHLAQHLGDGLDRDWGFAKQTLNDLLGQVIERAHDGLDPTGLLREFRHGSAHVAERVRDFLQTLTTPRGGAAPPAGGPPA